MGLFGFDRSQPAPEQGQDPYDTHVNKYDANHNHTPSAPSSAPAAATGDDVELLYLVDNPYGLQPSTPATGHFGPLPMRTTYDKFFYGCGAAYMFGLVGGGLVGLYRGVSGAQTSSFVVVRNSVLNQTTRYGPWAANSLGVLSLAWAAVDSTLASYRGDVSDNLNHVVAAFVAGAAFKSTVGVRPALLAGGVFASTVGAFCIARDWYNQPSQVHVQQQAPKTLSTQA